MQLITAQDVAALDISAAEAIEAVRQAFLAARRKEILWWPKTSLSGKNGTFSTVTHAMWQTRKISLCHSITGTAPGNVPAGQPHYSSTQILGDLATGQCMAVYDGQFTSNILPVAVTALGARHLADPRSRCATFVGAGTQARLHLDLLAGMFPLEQVRVLTRSSRPAQAFREYAQEKGLRCAIELDPRSAIESAPLVITTVSSVPGLKPFLDPAWLASGAFLSAVDLARSWLPGMEKLDLRVIDDLAQAEVQEKDGRLGKHGPYSFELAELLEDSARGRQDPAQRVALIHPGNVVGVLGITWLIHERLEASRSQVAAFPDTPPR